MSDNVMPFPGFPRAVKPAPEPLGLFFRPGRNDHGVLLNMLASGDASCFGAVIDPTRVDRHSELRDVLIDKRLDAILDPLTQQLALPGSYGEKLAKLPWANNERPHTFADFKGSNLRGAVSAIGDYIGEQKFTKVLAPTHLIRLENDPWLEVDIDATIKLRAYLDNIGLSGIPIVYSLALSYKLFRDKTQRRKVIARIKALPVSEIWLKIDRFGSHASPTATLAYIEAAKDFAEMGVPLVADHVGGAIGMALLAFGSAGGLAHGITLGERFDSSNWRKISSGTPFSPPRRVYFPTLDMLLKPSEARALIDSSARMKAMFGCSDGHCCPRGTKDQLENAGRHFVVQRMKELGSLSQIPEQLRPQRFLDSHLRPATDKALAAATINWGDDGMAKRMQENRKRLDALRVTLGKHAEGFVPTVVSLLPQTRAAREARN